MTQREAPPAVECRGIYKHFGAIRANGGVDLKVPRGTVHGIIGENGAGKSTLMGLLYEHFPPDAGEIKIAGRPARFRSPKDAIAAGIGMVHRHFVLVETFTVVENLLLGCEQGPLLRGAAQAVREDLARFAADFDLALDPDAIAGSLPVGLRQRLEILKALRSGADIAASHFIHRRLLDLREAGTAILLVSADLDEIRMLADRILVMEGGRIAGALGPAASERELALLMGGILAR